MSVISDTLKMATSLNFLSKIRDCTKLKIQKIIHLVENPWYSNVQFHRIYAFFYSSKIRTIPVKVKGAQKKATFVCGQFWFTSSL